MIGGKLGQFKVVDLNGWILPSSQLARLLPTWLQSFTVFIYKSKTNYQDYVEITKKILVKNVK